MKHTLIAAAAAFALTTGAKAENIGVTMAQFDDNFLTILRNGIQEMAEDMDGVEVRIEDAGGNTLHQIEQINGFIAEGVDAIIVNPVDTSATYAMTAAAESAGVPLVYVNRQPINLDVLPDNQAFVASDEVESGTLEAFEVCKILRRQGKSSGALAYLLMGDVTTYPAIQRTKDVHDILATDMCSFISLIDEQSGNWSRDEARRLMSFWLLSGQEFDAVFANNDEMAIGAIEAMKEVGLDMSKIVVGGVDATPEALAAMQAGDLDVTVFQNAAGQGTGALRTALALARGENVDQKVFIPFELVTPQNMGDYTSQN